MRTLGPLALTSSGDAGESPEVMKNAVSLFRKLSFRSWHESFFVDGVKLNSASENGALAPEDGNDVARWQLKRWGPRKYDKCSEFSNCNFL